MKNTKRLILTLIGPVLFLLCYFFLPESVFSTVEMRSAIGTVAWMAFWWITSPVDIAVTAFLPIAMNALFQMTDMSVIISQYAAKNIILLLGASFITVSWEETNLDKRIAARCLSLIGSSVRVQVTFWFIIGTVLSAVLPNAVVCATITPIAVAMLRYVGEKDIATSKVGSLLLLTIAYAAGLGGLASPLGGAMNLVVVDYLEQLSGQEFMYSEWVIRFLPIMIVLIVSNIIMLLIGTKKGDTLNGSKEYFLEQYKSLPKMTREEVLSLSLFIIATVLAFTRDLYKEFLPGLEPAYVFVICGILAFFITNKNGERIMKWSSAQKKLPWDMIYVFAGGMAVGALIEKSGAAESIGNWIAGMNIQGGFIAVLIIVTFTLLMSDITSNTATAAVAIPIVIALANGMGENPIPYVYVATIGVNLSYMLPTSIRAIPVGYGLQPKYMLKKGVPITIVVIALMSILGWLLIEYWPAFSTTV